MNITTAGLVIHDVTIAGCMTLNAPNVTFRNVRITGNCGYVVDTPHNGANGPAYSTGTNTFDHVTIVCTGGGGTAIGEARIKAVAMDISGCENGFDLDDTITLQDSYIHNLAKGGTTHSDGIQVWAGATHVAITHNTFLVRDDTSAFITGGQSTGVLIANNLLDGGAYTVYCAGDHGILSGNRWGPIFPGTGYPAGHTSDCGNMTQSGNILDADNSPLGPLD